MSTEHWLEFWKKYGRDSMHADDQTQVLRTVDKQPISPERWQQTLDYIDAQFPVTSIDEVLDLCSGNGLFSAHFSPLCSSVTAVDISAELLAILEKRNLYNVKTMQADIRKLTFDKESFSRILLYAGIQYLSESDVVILFREMFQWMKPGGLLFIGDIPDRMRIWNFYNTAERIASYFDNQVSGQDVIGTWFDHSWLLHLAESTGFSHAEIISQPNNQLNAHFRFDFKTTR